MSGGVTAPGVSHTPTPWKEVTYGDEALTGRDYFIHSETEDVIARVFVITDRRNGPRDDEHEANAALIVRACNAWDNAEALRARLSELEAR